jgi:hypothetical protein
VESTYTLNLEEERGGDLHIGTNVPLSPNGPRQDIGLAFHGSVTPVGEDLLLHNTVELSATEEASAGGTSVRKVVASGDAVISPGKPALVNSLEDPTTHRRFQVTVSATKLR